MVRYLLIFCLISFQCQAEKPLCKKQGCCSKKNKDTHQCYCSVKCGPREIGTGQKTDKDPSGDNPFYDYPVDKNGVRQEEYRKHCFCQHRDQEMYIKNNCANK